MSIAAAVRRNACVFRAYFYFLHIVKEQQSQPILLGRISDAPGNNRRSYQNNLSSRVSHVCQLIDSIDDMPVDGSSCKCRPDRRGSRQQPGVCHFHA